MISQVFQRFPALEVAARLAYWHYPQVQKFAQSIRRRSEPRIPPPSGASHRKIDFKKVLSAISDAGVRTGDILVVHSSYKELQDTGLTPAEIIVGLKELVGETGTLAMPAIPIIAGEPQGTDKLGDAAYDKVFTYNVPSTRIWTGALPKELMGVKGAARSRHPGNSMVAVGPHAQAMMASNIDGPEPMPCGPGSSWAYCYRHNAKVIALGVDFVHSLTMIHVAEDCFADEWPIEGWYRKRRYRIKDGSFDQEIVVRERKHMWSQYYAERAFSRDLYKHNIATTKCVDGVDVHACDSERLITFLRTRKRPGYPFFFPLGIPKVHRKHELYAH